MHAIDLDQAEVMRQTQRAAELLDLALSALREAGDDDAMPEVTGLVDRARTDLARVLERRDGWPQGLLASNQALSDALAQVREGELASRQAQSVEAITRAQALIYPIALEHWGDEAKPPPLPRPRRPSQAPRPAGVERRRSPRAVLETEVSFESATNFFTGFTEDLSDGGLFVATYNLQPLGTQIELSFTLPDGHVIRTRGEVRWLRDPRDENLDAPPGMGIMFDGLPPEDLSAIQQFLQARAPIFYDE